MGILLASLNLVDSFLGLPYHPLRSLVVPALDVLVIRSLRVHRREDAAY